MESVILFATGAMLGGVAGLIGAALLAASGNQKIRDENARMRKVIRETHKKLGDLKLEAVKSNYWKRIDKLQDQLKDALEEG